MTETITISNEQESKYFTYDILQAVMKKNGKGIPLNKIYDSKVFWDSMGERFYKAFDRPEKCGFGVDFFVDRLKELQPVESVLDVGCGFGRLAPFLLQSKMTSRYTGIDISSNVLKSSEQYFDTSVRENQDIEKIQGFFMNGQLTDETRGIVQNDIKSVIESLKKKAEEKSAKLKPNYMDKVSLSVGVVRKIEFDSNLFDVVISNECVQHLNYNDAVEACREIARVSKLWIVMLERWAFPGEHSEPHIWSHNYSDIFSELGLGVLQITTIAAGLQGVVVRKR